MSTNSKEKQREYNRTFRMKHPEAMVTPEQARIYKQKFHANHRARGLCIECSNPLDTKGSRCSQCLARRRIRTAQKKLENAANGQCELCSEKALEGHRLGLKCYLKEISRRHLGTTTGWHNLLELFEKQNGQCALSGLPLTLGVNADIDHIIPRIRGGNNDLSNLQWILARINPFKGGMPEDEFFTFIEGIYLTMKVKYK